MFTNIPTNILALAIVLGSLIFIHEAGHFLVAKLFKVRVLVFSLGFGNRLFGFRRGDTDYRVSAFPLGGYVRMAGDTPEEGRSGDPGEFLSKPKWQRFLILFAGPLMNLLVAITIVAGLSMIGLKQLITEPKIGSVTAGKPAARAGLQVGDRIVSVDGERVNDFDDLRMLISMNADRPLRVVYERNGQQITTTLTPEKQETDYGPVGKAGFGAMIAPVLGGVEPDSPAAKAGLRAGDRITAVNGKPVLQFEDFGEVAATAKGAPLAVDVVRNGAPAHLTIASVAFDQKTLYRGILPPFKVQKLNVAQALSYSLSENVRMLRYSFVAIGRLIRGQGSVKELSGPGTIARISGEMFREGWIPLVGFMAMISLQLGIMNLLPIPVLDGGHIMIVLVEGVVRRDLSLHVKERITQVGFALLAALMIVVIYNDLLTNVPRLWRG